MATNDMQVMVIGTGSIGRRHAANLSELGATAHALSWQEHGMDGTLRALDTHKPDAAVIATATDIRLPLIRACASRDIPLYIEKPLAYRQADIAEIYAAAAPVAGRSLIGFMMRYHPMLRALYDLNVAKAYRFDFEIGHDVTQWRENWRFGDSYAARADGGGVLLDLCHELDMAHTLFPDLTLDRVSSLGHKAFPGVDMASSCHVRTAHGAGVVAMDYLAPASTRRARFRSQAACVEADFGASTLTIDNGDGPTTRDFAFDRNHMFLSAMSDFLGLVAGDAPDKANLSPTMPSVRATCDLIATAWESRRFEGTIEKDLS